MAQAGRSLSECLKFADEHKLVEEDAERILKWLATEAKEGMVGSPKRWGSEEYDIYVMPEPTHYVATLFFCFEHYPDTLHLVTYDNNLHRNQLLSQVIIELDDKVEFDCNEKRVMVANMFLDIENNIGKSINYCNKVLIPSGMSLEELLIKLDLEDDEDDEDEEFDEMR